HALVGSPRRLRGQLLIRVRRGVLGLCHACPGCGVASTLALSGDRRGAGLWHLHRICSHGARRPLPDRRYLCRRVDRPHRLDPLRAVVSLAPDTAKRGGDRESHPCHPIEIRQPGRTVSTMAASGTAPPRAWWNLTFTHVAVALAVLAAIRIIGLYASV